MCPRKAWARTPPGRNWLSQGPRLTSGAVSSIGRIAQDAEVVGQRPETPRYKVEDDMTARRFAARSSPGLDGGKEQALMSPVGATAAIKVQEPRPTKTCSSRRSASDGMDGWIS